MGKAKTTWGVEVKESRERECYYVAFWIRQGDDVQAFSLQPDHDSCSRAEWLADILRIALGRLAGTMTERERSDL